VSRTVDYCSEGARLSKDVYLKEDKLTQSEHKKQFCLTWVTVALLTSIVKSSLHYIMYVMYAMYVMFSRQERLR
jgi:hypothetical protein